MPCRAFNHAQSHFYTRSRSQAPCVVMTHWDPMASVPPPDAVAPGRQPAVLHLAGSRVRLARLRQRGQQRSRRRSWRLAHWPGRLTLPDRASGPGRAVGGLAGLGAAGADRRARGGRRRAPRGGTRPTRRELARVGPERDHLHRHRIGQVPWLPAAGADLAPGRRHRPVHRADQGAGGRSAQAGALARPAAGSGAAVVDGDTPWAERTWARSHANYLLTTPDMLHHSLLPPHARWNGFFRRLRYVIVDECHTYAACSARTSRTCCAGCGGSPTTTAPADPVFVLASATSASPPGAARCSPGAPCVAVSAGRRATRPADVRDLGAAADRCARRGGAPVRRAATSEAAQLLADLVRSDVAGAGVRPVPARGRVGRAVRPAAPDRGRRRSTWPTGSRPTGPAICRRSAGPWRRRCEPGRSPAWPPPPRSNSASTCTGLDAVLMAGWPGTRAALWQQAGRAGRDGRDAVAVLIARDDPLDTYLVHHPQALLGAPVEATVLDPDNSYVLAPHLCAAAAELPLTEHDLAGFSPQRRPPWRPGWPPTACCALAAAGGSAPGMAWARAPGCAAPAAGRCGSSSMPPAGWSARWTSRPRTSWRTRAPSTRTRARCTW